MLIQILMPWNEKLFFFFTMENNMQHNSSKSNLNSAPDSAWNHIRISIVIKLFGIPNTGVLSIIPLL